MIIRLTAIAALAASLAACNPPASDGGATTASDTSDTANVDTPAVGATSGRAMPAGFPAFLTPMPGATVTEALATPEGQMVQYRIDRPMEEVLAFHREAATDAGMAPTGDAQVGESHMLARGEDHGFVISTTPDGPGATRVSIANTTGPTE